MNGWLIYTPESASRNKECIDIYLKEAKRAGIKLELKFEEDRLYYEKTPDFAIMRTYNYLMSRELEKKGVKVFNNSFVSEICNDKEKTYLYAKSNSIPVMDTFLYDPENIPFDYPFIVKPASGHGGKGVSLVNNDSELKRAVSDIKNDKILIQKKASLTGKDLRVYVIGNKIIRGIMRESEKDFRSNFSLGGKAFQHELNENEKQLIQKVMKVFSFDYVGIDIIYDNGDPVLNEIEDVAGARMLYINTDINIISMYIDHIISVMNEP